MVLFDLLRRSRVVLFVPLLVFFAGGEPKAFGTPPEIEKRLQEALAALASRPHTINAVALVHAPKADFVWCNAVGLANPTADEPMTANHLFRIASVTKSFTAVVVLQLIEEGRFTLDTPLADLLSPSDLPEGKSVNDLLILAGKPSGNRIRVRHLLSHKSGLADYWSEEIVTGRYQGKSFLGLLAEDSRNPGINGLATKQWSPEEIIGFYCDCGFSAAAKGRPGESYYYSDTNFVLLGLVVQKLTGKKLHEAFRQRVYKTLGMEDTYLEWYEECPRGRISHHFWFDETAEGGGRNVDLMDSGYNSSADWAGGGIVTTASDLNRFLRGLFGQRLFKSKDTLSKMLTAGETGVPELRYGLGLYRVETKSGQVGWGHFGACGVSAFYFPSSDVSIVLTRNQKLGLPYIQDIEKFVSVLERMGLI